VGPEHRRDGLVEAAGADVRSGEGLPIG